jgi:hypothetical protein
VRGGSIWLCGRLSSRSTGKTAPPPVHRCRRRWRSSERPLVRPNGRNLVLHFPREISSDRQRWLYPVPLAKVMLLPLTVDNSILA